MNRINLINQRIALNYVCFKRHETSSVKPKLYIKDSIENIRVCGKNFSFDFRRKAYFDPDSFFTIEVVFIYLAELSDDSLKSIEEEKKIFDAEYVKSIAIKIINNTTIPSHASVVIANNTAINGAAPLVTQPSFIE